MKNRIRRIFHQLGAWKGYYVLLALLCVISAAGGLFVAEMLRSAALLRTLSFLPYEGYYRLERIYPENIKRERNTEIDRISARQLLHNLKNYKNISDTLATYVATMKVNLIQFKKDYNPSKVEYPELLLTVVPESAYDDDFRELKRVLVAGRHIVREDENVALLDESLAELNGIGIGDTFTTERDIVYTVVGLYQTLIMDSLVREAMDVPQNMIYVSDTPEGTKNKLARNVYIKFSYTYTDAEVADFLEEMMDLSGTNFMLQPCTVVPVDEINHGAAAGVTSMINLSLACAAVLLAVIVAGLSLFITVLMKKRSHEFQLMNALGKKKNAVIADFGAELALVMLPSLGIGLYASARLLIGYIDGILEYFSSMVSEESIQATTSFSVKSMDALRSSASLSLEPSVILADAAILLGVFLVIGGICLLVNRRGYVRTPVMQVLAER